MSSMALGSISPICIVFQTLPQPSQADTPILKTVVRSHLVDQLSFSCLFHINLLDVFDAFTTSVCSLILRHVAFTIQYYSIIVHLCLCTLVTSPCHNGWDYVRNTKK
jgi:hypothetical protein